MSKIKKLNARQLKKAGHIIVKEPIYINDPIYINGEGFVIPANSLSAGQVIIFRNVIIRLDKQHEK